MRALRAMLVLLPMLAFAGWRQVGSVTAPVQDVQVVDAGVVLAVSSASGATAWHVSDAGVVTQIINFPGNYVGAGFFGTGCVVALDNLRNLNATPGCGLPATANFGMNTAVRFRLLSDQPPLAIAVTNATAFDQMYSGVGTDAGWSMAAQGFSYSGVYPRSLQNARIGGVDYALLTVNGPFVKLSIDGGAPSQFAVPAALQDAVPFPRRGAPAMLGSVNGALTLIPDLRTPVLVTPSIPTGFITQYIGIGGPIGMATTSTGQVLSPVPDPSRPAEVWRVRSGAPLLTSRISCVDDRWCASATTAGVVWFWVNEVAPLVSVTVPQFDAGQTVRLAADAGDGDGDPIFVSWRADGGTLVAVTGIDDGTEIDFTVPSGACGVTSVDVTITDGLPEHDRTIQVPLPVIDRGFLQTDAGAGSVLAGGPAVAFTAAIVGGCAVGNLTWSTADGQMGSGGQFWWTPPVTECTAGGRQVTITATATWPSGAPATTWSSQIVTVVPWGPPAAPVFAPAGTQQGGTTADWLSSGAEHVCSTSSGFPGTELLWTNLDAGPATIQFIDGGLRIDAPVSCVPYRVSATANRQVAGEDAGRISGAGALVVDLLPDTAPLGPTTPFSLTVEGDGGWLFGELDAGASCLAERRLVSEVTVSSAGAALNHDRFPTPGGWQLQVPGGCSGGTYEVIAQLMEDGGFTGATAQGSVSLPYLPARVGTLSVDRIDVVCGAGAKTLLTLLPAPDSCGSVDLSWRATAGPTLGTASGSGASLELQSQALDFSVVGQQIALEWVADAGPGNLDLATRTIELGVQPFLEASVRAQPPLRREEEAVSLEVTLKNTTACAVDGLSVTLALSGGAPVLESVLVDGVHAPARLTDQGVIVDGVSVPASGSVSIQLSARARLLSSPTVDPVASLNGYVVSSRPPTAAPATGCGCSELASPAFFGLFGLLVLRRRKRSTR